MLAYVSQCCVCTHTWTIDWAQVHSRIAEQMRDKNDNEWRQQEIHFSRRLSLNSLRSALLLRGRMHENGAKQREQDERGTERDASHRLPIHPASEQYSVCFQPPLSAWWFSYRKSVYRNINPIYLVLCVSRILYIRPGGLSLRNIFSVRVFRLNSMRCMFYASDFIPIRTRIVPSGHRSKRKGTENQHHQQFES